ncbi:MAG: RNA polymerase sigma-70 factor [Pedobacter sp.]|uniref:RNA polymerase sigma-70 factor n=1 Tax=Pedobacter sp. TaxID=1411316 RepID=UPI0035624029
MRNIDASNHALITPETVFNQNYGSLCYFAFQLIADKSIAEDLVQDAFVAYWSNKENVSTHPLAIKDFLYTAVRNSCLNLIRRKKVLERYLNSRNETDFSEEKIVHKIIESELIEKLYQAINTLPDGCKKVFKLGYLEGLSNTKIAETLNISVNTVRAQKQRGLKALKTRLDYESLAIFIAVFFN